ncbi:hypothetical protein SAMN05421823_111240 [Catalinimonas alkaloidigena]|uniref:Uncharacterized protein n=1 Tax=Catalinimonas alkaloidigena TaxID=1075417 RepID=A0A1G9RTB0_9BACT|nr:hypothetical protein [Catalinimonas alkaloidigena]SDM25735.1 hypothetical protein SAMN05421823_111240 [Catalinimonas alkaloidigena]
MDLHLQYVTNADGERIAVQIPLTEWEAYQAEFRKLENRLAGQKALKAEAETATRTKREGGTQHSLFSFD